MSDVKEVRMKAGLQVPYFTWPSGREGLGRTFGDVATRAEDVGFHSFWVMDHFFQLPGLGAADLDMLEGYSALAFAAAKTSTIKLGTMVTGVTYRHPGLLVKTATTLDVLSGGRAYFGIGAAWFEREHVGLGVPFPPMKERFERLEEALRIALQMWSDDDGPFAGKHYQLAETICVPRPLSQPHPPILIGGQGEKKTLRFVARYADATNLVGVQMNDDGVETVRRKLAILRAHCEAEGRQYEKIEKTVLLTLMVRPEGGGRWLTPVEAVELLRRFRDAGVDQAIFNMPDVDRRETLEYVADHVLRPIADW
jgi:F420-dependent oxidoreductase-like protein